MANIAALVSFKIFPPDMGGQKGVALFYRYLSRYHQIFMAASADNTGSAAMPYQVFPLLFSNKKMAANIFRLRWLKSLICKNGIDCIIAEHSYTGWLAYLLKKMTGLPFIIHSHNLESDRFRQMGRSWWKAYHRYEKWIHRSADHNFFISEEDLETAMNLFGLEATRCTVVPYGIDTMIKIPEAKDKLRNQFGITTKYLFYFNGTMDYEPNIEAVKNLAVHICPILDSHGLDYTLIISGKRLPVDVREQIRKSPSVFYTDFIENLELAYQGSDLFLNAVVNDSGVKTKLIEAIANGCTAVSTISGSAGIMKEICGSKLLTVEDNDWPGFAARMIESISGPGADTPGDFYTYYSWETVTKKAAATIDEVICKKS